MGPVLKASVTHAPVPRADRSDFIFLPGLLSGMLAGAQSRAFFL